MTDFVGKQLGNYRVIRLLGQGGFADVYLGEHIYLKTLAAIKIVQTRITAEDVNTFLNEARMISSLVHPNIVRVLEFGREGTTPFLVMDYAPNGTLRQRHPRGSRLPPAVLVPYVKQVASALQYAHDKKLIHRDIKPENMLIGPNNEVLLSDFGIALLAQSSRYQSMQDVVGTVAYMAPEQFQGKPVPASDQYALGVVVYEWLTGDRPFHGSFAEIASQHMLAFPSLRDKTPELSPPIEEVVRTALAKEPQYRFLRVQAFANAFEQAVQAMAMQSPFPSPVVPPFQSAAPGSPGSGTFPAQPQLRPPQVTPYLNPGASLQPQSPTPSSPSSLSSPLYGTQQPAQLSQSGQFAPPASGQLGNVAGQAAPFGAQQVQGQGWPSSPNYGQTPSSMPGAGQPGGQFPAQSAQATPLVVPPPDQALPHQLAASHMDQADSTYVMNRPPPEQGPMFGQGTASGGGFPPQGPVYPAQPQPQSPQQPAKRNISRRTLLIGSAAGALGLIVIGSSVAWLEITHQKNSPSTSGTTATASANNNSSPTSATTPNSTDTSTPQAADTSTPGSGSTPVAGVIATYSGHSRYIQALAWSPDNSKIATASGDGTVQVWNAASGTAIYTYTGHQNQNIPVNAVVWSQDGNSIFSAGTDVQVWKAADGTKQFTYTGHSNSTIHCLALSPDGKRIASGSDDDTAQIWDAQTGTHYVTHTANTGVRSLAWSPDGARIASTQNDQVEVWNSSNGNTLNTYKGHSGNNVNAIAWSHNGKHVASGSDDKTVQVWDAFSLSASYTYSGHAQTVYAVSWSPDDTRIASGGADLTVQVWNSSNGLNRFVYHGHSSQVNTVVWSSNGKYVASGSGDPNISDGSDDHTAQVWQPS